MENKTTVRSYSRNGVVVRSHERKKRSFRSIPPSMPKADAGALRRLRHGGIIQIIEEDQRLGVPETKEEKELRHIRYLNEGTGWVNVGEKNSTSEGLEIYIGPNGSYDGLNLSDCNFSGAKLSNCSFRRASLERTNLTKADLAGSDFQYANVSFAQLPNIDLSGADLTRTDFSHSILSGVNMSGSVLDGTLFLNTPLHGVNWEGTTVRNISIRQSKEWTERGGLYEQTTFRDAIQKFCLSDKQFEYFVLAGIIEVRDNETLKLIKTGFDPDKHHVPPWSMANFKINQHQVIQIEKFDS